MKKKSIEWGCKVISKSRLPAQVSKIFQREINKTAVTPISYRTFTRLVYDLESNNVLVMSDKIGMGKLGVNYFIESLDKKKLKDYLDRIDVTSNYKLLNRLKYEKKKIEEWVKRSQKTESILQED